MSDDNINLSRRNILGATAAVGVAGAGAGVGTSALFSDEESFEDNSITAGTLDMTVSAEIVAENTEYDDAVGVSYDVTADGAAATGLTLDDFKPGDWVIVCYEITIEDNPGYVLVQANDLVSNENGFEEPEPEDSNGEGELDDKLLTTVWDDYDDSGNRSGLSTLDIVTNNEASSFPDSPSTGHSWDSSRNEGGVVNGDIHYTTLQETYDDWFEDGFLLGPGPDSDASKIGGPANDQESKVVYLLLEVPVEVSNEIQGDSVAFDLEWRAEQVRNNDNPLPGPVINARTDNEFDELQPAVDAAQQDDTIRVREGASFDESVDIGVKNLTLEAISNTKPTIEQGVDILANGVTVDGFEIQNPGTQGSADPTSPAGLVGVHVNSGNKDASVLNNDITAIGTNDDDANPIGVLASDATSRITVEGNEISNLKGTDEDAGQVQGVLINESGTQITGATVNNNTITDLLDTRSTNAVRFNGDVKGEIIGNTISDLNTEGDIPGTNDPGGFTTVIALQEGDGSSTGPSDVTIQGNDVSNIETTTPGNFAPPVHLSLGSSASNITVGGTSSSDENSFSADSPDVEIFVQDGGGTLTLSDVQNKNSFTPSSQVGPGGSNIFPGDLRLVTDSDDLQTQINNASSGDTLAVDSGTFDAVTVDKSLSLKSIFGRPTVNVNSSTGQLEVSAPNVEISGFDIDLSNGEVVYVNPGEGLIFRNNVVDVSSSSDHGIRIDDSFGGPTVVEANVFNISSTDAGVNSQGILFSGGEDYLIKNNIINGPGKDADSPDDANAGIFASVQADTTDADIEDNEISDFDQGVLLFENPPSGNLDNFSITGNSISSADTGILAVELAGDGDTFSDINGESATSAQQQALESDNVFAASVDTDADVQADL